MATYRSVKTLSSVDAAYIAGLVDGEGTITLSRKHAGDGRQLVISISNTERAILDFVLLQIGAGKITGKKALKQQHAPSFAYAAALRTARDEFEKHFLALRAVRDDDALRGSASARCAG